MQHLMVKQDYGFKAQEILALEGDNVIIDNENEDNLKYKGEAFSTSIS
jgi:hypothetical protein